MEDNLEGVRVEAGCCTVDEAQCVVAPQCGAVMKEGGSSPGVCLSGRTDRTFCGGRGMAGR